MILQKIWKIIRSMHELISSEFNNKNRNKLGTKRFHIIKLLASISNSIHCQLAIRKEKGSRQGIVRPSRNHDYSRRRREARRECPDGILLRAWPL